MQFCQNLKVPRLTNYISFEKKIFFLIFTASQIDIMEILRVYKTQIKVKEFDRAERSAAFAVKFFSLPNF